MSKIVKSLNKNIIFFIVFAIIALIASVGLYYLSFKTFDNYIDKKIEAATLHENTNNDSNVHDVLIVTEAYTKTYVPFDVIVRSEQTYENCRLSRIEVSQMTSDIRNHIINVDINENTFKHTCDYIKNLANKNNIKVYDVILKESHTNKPYYFFKYAEQ